MAGNYTWIVDYGLGNLRSVGKAVEKAGGKPVIGDDPGLARRARAVILPGVGAFDTAAQNLDRLGLTAPLGAWLEEGKPFLGICLGFQLLFERSGEGREKGFGLLGGEVRRLPSTVKVPHIGWNRVSVKTPSALFRGLPGELFFYFVHSYYGFLEGAAAETFYGRKITAAVEKGMVCGTQFHPEKSGVLGILLLANFLRLAGAGAPAPPT